MAKIVTITLDSPPLSVNNSQRSGRNGRRYKIKQAIDWEHQINAQLLLNQKELVAFANQFDPFKHEISFDCYFYINEKRYFTEEKGKRRVSKRVGDTFNMVKHLEDAVFRFIGINDAFVNGGTIRRLATTGNPKMVIFLSFSDQHQAWSE